MAKKIIRYKKWIKSCINCPNRRVKYYGCILERSYCGHPEASEQKVQWFTQPGWCPLEDARHEETPQ